MPTTRSYSSRRMRSGARSGAAARIQRAFRNRRKTFRKKGTKYRFAGASKYSKRQSSITRAVSKAMNRVAETYIVDIHKTVPTLPNTWAGVNAKKTRIVFNLGSNSITGESLSPGNLLNVPETFLDGSNRGKYVFLNRSAGKYKIVMRPAQTQPDLNSQPGAMTDFNARMQPYSFRIIHATPNRRLTTSDPDISTDLFMKTNRDFFSYDSSPYAISNLDMMTQPLNRADFIITKDQKFKLQAPSQLLGAEFGSANPSTPTFSGISQTSKYPSEKLINFYRPIRKKVKYNSGSSVPETINDDMFVIILACFQDDTITQVSSAATNWCMEALNATTTFTNC